MSWAPEQLNFGASIGTDLASPDSYWRIIEYSAYDFDGSSPHYDTGTGRYDFDVYPWFGAGRVAADGSLTGLPDPYIASQSVPYVVPPAGINPGDNFTMNIKCQTGCLDEDTGLIRWHLWTQAGGDNEVLFGYRTTSPASDFP